MGCALVLRTANLPACSCLKPYGDCMPAPLHMQLLFFSFQGSESSTSEGITKTFAAAKAAAAAAGAGTIAVVLLDEVGLAEISPHNPLKVGPFCWQPSLAHGTKQTAAVVWRIALLCHQPPIFSSFVGGMSCCQS